MEKTKKIILTIIFLIIIFYLIYCIRNFIIYSNIYTNISSYYTISNVFYEKYSSENPENLIRYSKLNSLEKIETLKNNSIYLINWNDYTNNIFLNIFVEDRTIVNREKTEIYNLPFFVQIEDNSFFNKLSKSLTSFITTENFENTECYVISNISNTYWIEKDTGLILRKDEKTNINGNEKTISTIYKNWAFNNLKEEDLEKPNFE